MIFIYCNWVSSRWHWSVDLYKNRRETAVYMGGKYTRNITQNITKHKIHNIENKNTKQETNTKGILSNDKITKRSR